MRALRFLSSSQPVDDASADASPDAPPDAPESAATEQWLVVTDDEGERYRLAVDDALRAAFEQLLDRAERTDAVQRVEDTDQRSGNAHRTEDELPAVPSRPTRSRTTHLSPRDIQTRIRAGESPQDLAAETGMDVERVLRFGAAVLQERSRVGDEARRSRARRDGDGALVPFAETVDRRFVAASIDPADVDWDAVRRPDGSWIISASWPTGTGQRQAHWAFSLTARTVLPVDEAAADLLSERPLRAVVRAVPDAADADSKPVDDAVFDQEDPGGYTRSTSGGDATDRYGTPGLPLRLADPLPRPAADRPTLARAEHSDAPEQRAPAAIHLVNPRTDQLDVETDPQPTDADESLADALLGARGDDPSAPTDATAVAAASSSTSADDSVPAVDPPAGKPRRRSGREQVPSWDDILLGVRRKHD